MIDHVLFHDLPLVVLLGLCVIGYWVWQRSQAGLSPLHRTPVKRTTRGSTNPKPFLGLTTQPHCAAYEQAAQVPTAQPSPAPPPLLVSTRGRRREVNTRQHFCPKPTCRYYGRVGLGNIRANGHPGGGPWRQLQCVACRRYFQETHGTPLHSKRVPPEVLVWAVGALAEGLGIRAVARVFEVDPNPVLHWLMEAADHAAAFSQYFLHDVRVTQVQLDELFALLSAVKAGEISDAEAIARLSRTPHWVWVAIDPVSKLLLAIEVGERTLAIAQRLVHQIAQVVAPGCVPLFMTDGFKEYTMAVLTHSGQWVQPSRRPTTGPAPKPRWMPVPELLYAQVVKTYRRRAWSVCAIASYSAPWLQSSRC